VLREPKTVSADGFAGFAGHTERRAGIHVEGIERELARYTGVDYDPLRLTAGACVAQIAPRFWEERFHGARQDLDGIPATAEWTARFLEEYLLPEVRRFDSPRSIATTPPEKRNPALRAKQSPRPMRIAEGLDDPLGDALAQPRLLLARLAAGLDAGVDRLRVGDHPLGRRFAERFDGGVR
jgi:hypothetical protein